MQRNQSDHETGIEDICPGEAVAAERGSYSQLIKTTGHGEIAINNALIANMELSPLYLNLGYHPHFWFDVSNVDEVRLEGDKTIQVMEWIAKMRADWDLVYRAL